MPDDKLENGESEKPQSPQDAGRAGGLQRAKNLSGDERSDIARKAALSRWADPASNLPRATHDGPWVFGDITIPCAVLEDGRRVLMQEGIAAALGRKEKPRRAVLDTSSELPPFLEANNLKAFFPQEFSAPLTPITFVTKTRRIAYGYRAELLPDICGIYIDANDGKVLTHRQQHIYTQCKALLRGFARVGILAVVDEATGFQADKDREEYQRILEKYVTEVMRRWVSRFPLEFFKQVHRLQGWEWKGNAQGPRYVGKLINKYIYDRLPEGVREELQEKSPPGPDGRRKNKLYYFLTEDTGIPHLDKQIAAVTTLMQASESKGQFERMLQKVFPVAGEQLPLLSEPEPESSDRTK